MAGPNIEIQRPFVASGDALGGGGVSNQRRKFLRGLGMEVIKYLDGETEWWLEKARVGPPSQANGNSTALFNLGGDLKIGGDAGTGAQRIGSGAYKRGTLTNSPAFSNTIGVKCGSHAAANSETSLATPSGLSPRVGFKTRGFFRGMISDVDACDWLWGLSDDVIEDNVVVMGTAGAGEDFTGYGLAFWRIAATAANVVKLSMVIAGTPIDPLNAIDVTLNGDILDLGMFECGFIVDGVGAIEYYATHDYSKPELGAYGRVEHGNISQWANNAGRMGSVLAVNSNAQYADAEAWWVGQTRV